MLAGSLMLSALPQTAKAPNRGKKVGGRVVDSDSSARGVGANQSTAYSANGTLAAPSAYNTAPTKTNRCSCPSLSVYPPRRPVSATS